MERPERLVLVILGALFNRMAPVLWVIAVLSTITVIHRMRCTWTRTQDPPQPPKPAKRHKEASGFRRHHQEKGCPIFRRFWKGGRRCRM